MQSEIVSVRLQAHACRALVDSVVIFGQKARLLGELGSNPGEVLGFARGLNRRLAQCKTLVIPKLFHVLGAANTDQLQALKIRAVGQQNVGHVIGLVRRVGKADGERKIGDGIDDLACVPERNRRIGTIDDPDIRRLGFGEFIRRLALQHPGQVRRPQGLAPGRIGGQRHQGLVRVAVCRPVVPTLCIRRVHGIIHEAINSRLHTGLARRGRAIQAHRSPERSARHFQGADQTSQHGPGPTAIEPAPAVVDRLPKRHSNGTERQFAPVDDHRFAHMGVVDELVGEATHRLFWNIADFRCPGGRLLADVFH